MRTAVVTQATQFAGPGAVTALRGEGYRVLACDAAFAASAQADAFAQLNPGVELLALEAPEAIVEAAWARLGRVDFLLSNDAFPAIHGAFADARVEDLRETLERLTVRPFRLVRAALPHLR